MKRLISKHHIPLLLVPLILFSPVIVSGRSLFWGTVSTQFVPWWDFAWDTVLQGQIPLWNPWVGMGAPLVANYQSAIFYPPYWLLLLVYALAGVSWMSWAVTFVVVFHLAWSGLGVAKIAQTLGLNRSAQIVAGLAFCLSGYLVARAGFLSINAAAAWLPWIMYYGMRVALRKKNATWMLGISMALQLLTGHAQTTWYSLLLGGIWTVFWSFKDPVTQSKLKNFWRSLTQFILAGLMGAAISAIQLLPTIEYLLQSQRAGEYGYAEAMTYSFWPWRFLTLVVPNIFGNPAAGNYWGYGNYWEDAVYIGLLPILIGVGAAVRGILRKPKDEDFKSPLIDKSLLIFLGCAVLIGFLLALGINTSLFPFLYEHVPTFNLFQAPTRFSLWAEISLAILAGIGVHQLSPPRGRRQYWMRLAAAGCFAVLGGSFLGWLLLSNVKTTFFIPIGWAGFLGLGTALVVLFQPERDQVERRKIWNGLLIMLVAIDLLAAGWGLNPGIKSTFYEKVEGWQRGARVFIPADLEYNLKFKKFFRFESFNVDLPWEEMYQDLLPNLPLLQRIEMVNNFDPLVPARYQRWMDEYNKVDGKDLHPMTRMMKIGYIVSPAIGPDQAIDLAPVESFDEVRLVRSATTALDDEAVLTQILNGTIDFSEKIILTSLNGQISSTCQSGGRGEIVVVNARPGYVKINSNLAGPSWLIWSQTWYPGWTARIDGGQRVTVERANFLFQAVCVPAGDHTVEFIYRPVLFYLGAGITILSIVGLLIVVAWKKSRKKAT
jgi:hypothetical protein